MRGKILLLSILIPVLLEAGVWPFYRHDTLGTGVSQYKGPQCCNIECDVKIEHSFASPVIDGSKHLYMQGVCQSGVGWCLWCVNTPDCSRDWEYQFGMGSAGTGAIHSSCAISPVDGTIYVGYRKTLQAINSDSTFKWSYTTGGSVHSSPAIASDGTIYVGCTWGYLYAIDSTGTLKWKYQTGSDIISSPAIGSDGTIYVGSNDKKLYAINPDSTFKWDYLTGDYVESSPAIGSDGTIYVGSNDGYLYAIKPDGSFKWKYDTGGAVKSSPAVDDVNNVVYVGSDSKNIYAISTGGAFKWETPLVSAPRYSSPAVAQNNVVYIGDSKRFYVITASTGTIICKNEHNWPITSPTIDKPDGGSYCVWYNEFCVAVYKVCCPPTGIEEKCSCVRNKFQLHLYPNPLVTATKISFTLPTKANIKLEVYDISGRLIEVVAKENYDAGEHTIEWNADGIKKGIYFCKLSTESQTLIRKMILLRKGEKR